MLLRLQTAANSSPSSEQAARMRKRLTVDRDEAHLCDWVIGYGIFPAEIIRQDQCLVSQLC
jgi:hypothetical protein